MFNVFRNRSFYGDATPTGGIVDLHHKKQGYQHNAVDYNIFNNNMNQFSSSASVATVMNSIRTYQTNVNGVGNIRCWASPINGACFENIEGTSNGTNDVSAYGKFNKDAFDNANGNHSIVPSSFPDLTPGRLWYAMTIIRSAGLLQGYMGTVFINFKNLPATGSNGLSDIFFPSQGNHYVEALVVHGNGSSEANDSISVYNNLDSQYTFSSDANANTNGYYQPDATTFKMSVDSGIWGFRSNRHIDGYLNSTTSTLDASAATLDLQDFSYGIQNLSSTDSSASTIHWHDQEISDTGYKVILWTAFS